MSNNAVAAITQTHVSAVQSTLTKVLLSNTGLKTLPQFSEFSKLSTLVVSSNNMGGELNFTAPPGLKLLDLGGNDYTSINLTLYHMLDFASVADNTRLSALVANATIPHIDISNTSIPFDNTTICTTIGTTQLAAHAMKHVTWKTNFFQALNYCLQHSESLDFEDVPQLPLWQVIAATNRWYTIGPAPPGFSFTSDEANLDMYYPARRLPELRLGRNFPVQCTTYLQPKTIYRVLVSDFVHFNVTFDVVAGATFSCGCVVCLKGLRREGRLKDD